MDDQIGQPRFSQAKVKWGLGLSSLYALNRRPCLVGPEGGLIHDVRRGFRSTWTSIVQEVKKLQNQGVNIFDYIRIKIGNGDNTSFWKDKWHNEGVLKDVFSSWLGKYPSWWNGGLRLMLSSYEEWMFRNKIIFEKVLVPGDDFVTVVLILIIGSLKLGDFSINAYFCKIESIPTILTSLGSPISNDDVVTIALEGLPDNSMLTTQEMPLKSRSQALHIDSLSYSPTILLAKSGNDYRSNVAQVKSSRPCFNFAKGSCHFGDTCGDVDEIEFLLRRDPSTPKMSVVSILKGFTDEPPLEENDDLFDLEYKANDWKKILYDAPIDDLMTEDKVFDHNIHKKKISPTYVSLSLEDRHYLSSTYVIRTFLPYFTYPVNSSLPLSFRSEDIIFDPDISTFYFSSLEPVAYECPMEVCSSTCFIPNNMMILGESS
ncbi:replication protein A 70 kDa DNA-binding subunit B [Tanacetum coccineum]